MKKLFFALLFFPGLLWAQTRGFVVTGKINGLNDGEASLTSIQDVHQVIASGKITQGAFTLNGTVPEPGLYWLNLNNEKPTYIYLENKDIAVSGDKTDLKHLKIEGSASQKDFDVFQEVFNPLIGQINTLGADIQNENDPKKRQQLMKDYDALVAKTNVEVDHFVSERKSSYVSPFVLFVTAQLSDNPTVIENRFNKLDENVKNSQIGKSLVSYIAYNKIGAVGTQAMDFTQNDTEGKPVTLSSFKGKYVLVDFWASWCRPCRMENPNVVRTYNKFKDKNFTILSVSLDQKKESWIRAIQSDGLKWTNVSDLKFWENEAAVLYHIQSIPQNFLIDPQGKIVAKDLRGEELSSKLCELLGCN